MTAMPSVMHHIGRCPTDVHDTAQQILRNTLMQGTNRREAKISVVGL